MVSVVPCLLTHIHTHTQRNFLGNNCCNRTLRLHFTPLFPLKFPFPNPSSPSSDFFVFWLSQLLPIRKGFPLVCSLHHSQGCKCYLQKQGFLIRILYQNLRQQYPWNHIFFQDKYFLTSDPWALHQNHPRTYKYAYFLCSSIEILIH